MIIVNCLKLVMTWKMWQKKTHVVIYQSKFSKIVIFGDPHPGNLLVRDGKICFIDFGIMGEVGSGEAFVLKLISI